VFGVQVRFEIQQVVMGFKGIIAAETPGIAGGIGAAYGSYCLAGNELVYVFVGGHGALLVKDRSNVNN
jgi:hypothetical protein